MSLTPFFRLPFAVPASGTALDLSKVSPLFSTAAEVDAAGHWLLGGSSESLTDIRSGSVLTFAGGGTAPVYGSNYVRLAGANGGLKSAFDDRLDRTVCGVFKKTVTGATLIAGAWSAGGAGAVLYLTGGTFNVAATPTAVACPGVVGDWVFFALTTRTDLTRLAKFGGGAATTGSAAHTLHGKLSLHDQSAAGFTGTMDYAEFIVWNRSMLEAEINAVYARSQARMAARGLTVI